MEKSVSNLEQQALKRGGNGITNFKVEKWNGQSVFISGWVVKSHPPSQSLENLEFKLALEILSENNLSSRLVIFGTAITTIGTIIYLV